MYLNIYQKFSLNYFFSSGYHDHVPVPNSPDHDSYALDSDLNFNKTVFLFDILADPEERLDLSESHPDVVQELLDRLWFYNSTAVPCRFPPPDDRASPRYHGGVWGPWL